MIKQHCDGIFVSEPINYPVGKQARKLIKQMCKDDEIETVDVECEDGKTRSYVEMSKTNAKRCLNEAKDQEADSHTRDRTTIITEAVKPLEEIVKSGNDEIRQR